MSSRGESKIPSPVPAAGGGTNPAPGGATKKKSLLPAPKTIGKPRGIPRPSSTGEKQPTPEEPPKEATVETEAQFRVGDRVRISGIKTGVVHFVGRTHFAEGQWCGVVLDESDGKHDGQVGGVRYFQCTENHGIFAPVQKVEICPEDLYMYDSPAYSSEDESKRSSSPDKKVAFQREHSTPPEKVTRLPMPKSHNRSKSLDSDISNSPEQGKSKLARPKSFSRSLSNKDKASNGDSTSSSRESSVNRDTEKSPRSKPSRLVQPKGGGSRKAEKRSAKHVTRESTSEDEHTKVEVRGKKSKTSDEAEIRTDDRLDGTFVKEDAEGEEEEDPDLYVPGESSPPRVDTKTALTLAYNLESSGSDSEATKQQLNATFDKNVPIPIDDENNMNATFQIPPAVVAGNLNATFNKENENANATFNKGDGNVTFNKEERNTTFNKDDEDTDPQLLSKPSSGATSSLQSPIPDLLTSAGFVRQASLEWEEEPADVMGTSTADLMGTSTASLGILSETQLMDNSFLGEEFREMLRKKELLQQLQQDGIEAEVDKEIAGIATPEIDMSSSTLSGKESSPEPEARPIAKITEQQKKENFDITFDRLQIKSSTPMSPPSALKAAGEKLATPVSECIAKEAQMLVTKLYEEELTNDNATFGKDGTYSEKMDVDSESEAPSTNTFVAEDVDVKTGSKRKRTSTDLEEMKCHRLSASFELAKTAVEQYASLVQGAEEEKAQKKCEDARLATLKKTDIMNTSMETRVAKVAAEDIEGLEDVSFPEDLMASFTRAVERQYSDESTTDVAFLMGQKLRNNATFTEELVHDGTYNKLGIVDIEPDPDSLNVLTERAISQDSLDNFENIQKDNKPQDTTIVLSAENDECPDQAVITPHLQAVTEDQLRADLEAGDRVRRPVSLVSSCSADTGIMADSVSGERQERPVSMVSTSSVDTGYQDAEPVAMTTTGSPTPPPPGADGIDEQLDVLAAGGIVGLTAVQGTSSTKGDMSLAQYSPDGASDEDKDPESDRAAKGPPQDRRWTATNGESDMEEHSQPEGGESEPEETSGTESQQGDDTTVQEIVTPETDMDQASLSPDEPTAANTTVTMATTTAQHTPSGGERSKEESMETSDTDLMATSMDTEMVESATMKDVMEKHQPTNQNATFEAPNQNATFEAPNQNATFEAPNQNATFEAPNQNATFEASNQNATFDSATKLNATFEGNATFEATNKNATFQAANGNATFEAANQNATFEEPKKDMSDSRTSPPERLVQALSVEAHVTERELPVLILEQQQRALVEESKDSDRSSPVEMEATESVSPTVIEDVVEEEKSDIAKPAEDMEVCSEDTKSMNSEEGVDKVSESGQGDANKELAPPGKSTKSSLKPKMSPRKRKDVESSAVPSSKNPRQKTTPDSNTKSDAKKPSPKLVVKSTTGPLKRPSSAGTNSTDKSNTKKTPIKTLKNVSNKKKADVSSSSSNSPASSQKGTPEKKVLKKLDPATREKEKQLSKARKQLDLLQSVPSAPEHLTSVEVRPVTIDSSGDEKPSPPVTRRSISHRPGTTTTANKPPKPETTTALKGIPKPGTSRLGLPRPTSASNRRASAIASSSTKPADSTTDSTEGTKVAPKRSLPSRIGSRLPPRKSSGAGVAGSDAADGASKSSRPPTASRLGKPGGLAAMKRPERAQSMGSDTQGSRSSEAGVTSPGPRRPPSGNKRKSLVEPGIKRPGGPDPQRRATLAVTTSSRLIGPKASGLNKGGIAPLATSTPASKRPANQNKNKPVRASSSSPAGHHGNNTSSPSATTNTTTTSRRTPNQPDLVTNAITSDNNTAEITRLEALCEARTKELTGVKLQLRHRGTGLEAMTVLVKYLTEELNAFSCPLLTAQLAEAKAQLQRAALQLEELTNQRDALIAEIQCIKSAHTAEVERLGTDHRSALSALEERLHGEREDAVNEVAEKHSQEVKTLKSFHERRVCEVETDRDKQLKQKELQYEEELTRRKLAHDKQIKDLHKEHESKLTEITMRFENIKINLLEKVEFLRSEGEDLRRREATMLDKCQRDSEYKYQHALAQYKQEADSLHAVMDLRNAEIHDLRRRNAEMEKQLEELPPAQEKVKALTQKVENLQAIIEIRADNERTLAEKHSVLLRKFDRESKAMKRLSMDNDELSYRLSVSMSSDCGSPDSFRRSISHSPTNSESGTPEPSRRLKSPMPPHSPRSPNDAKRTHSSGATLRRSGTYELLNQGFDDESKSNGASSSASSPHT